MSSEVSDPTQLSSAESEPNVGKPRQPRKGRFVAGGTVQAVSNAFYLERPADQELLQLCRAGEYAYILAPRQIGKSSLMNRTAETLETEGIKTAIVDLNLIGSKGQQCRHLVSRLYKYYLPGAGTGR